MRTEWPIVRLGDLCDRVTVGHVGKMSDQYVDSGVVFFRSQDVKPFQLDIGSARSVAAAFADSLTKSELYAGDVVIVRTGYPGTAAVVPDGIGRANCADLVVVTPGPNLDPHVLVTVFNSTFGKRLVNGRLVGAAQQHFNVSAAKALELRLPPIEDQRVIGSIVRSFNDLIENNRRRIEILEKMARLLYREWFVHFRFPGHEDVVLVDSDLGSIPEGWGQVRLADACSLVMGQSPKSEYYNDIGEGLPFHQGVSDFARWFPTHTKWTTVDKRVAEPGDILFSVRAPVGRINVAPDRLVVGRGLSAIRALDKHQCFLLMQLKDSFATEDSIGGGTIFNSVTKKDMESILLLRSPSSIVQEFEAVAAPVADLIGNLSRLSIVLSEARDLLMPRLVSGELDVSELDLESETLAV